MEVLYICGFSGAALDANSLLKNFRQLKYLKIAHSNFTHISKDFPPLPMIEIINITFTKLAYTRPSLFEKLTELKELDLRLNELDHMEGPLLIHSHFEAMYLSGKMRWFRMSRLNIFHSRQQMELHAEHEMVAEVRGSEGGG